MTPTDTVFSILTQINFLCDKFKGKKLTENTDEELSESLAPHLEPLGMMYKETGIYSTAHPDIINEKLFIATCDASVNVQSQDLIIQSIKFEPTLKGNGHLSVNEYLNRIRKEAIQAQINEYDIKVAQINEELIQAKESLRVLMFRLQEIR